MDKFSMTPIQKRIEKLVTNGFGFSQSSGTNLQAVREIFGIPIHDTILDLQRRLAYLDMRTTKDPHTKLDIFSKVLQLTSNTLGYEELTPGFYQLPTTSNAAILDLLLEDLGELPHVRQQFNPFYSRGHTPQFITDFPLHPSGPKGLYDNPFIN